MLLQAISLGERILQEAEALDEMIVAYGSLDNGQCFSFV